MLKFAVLGEVRAWHGETEVDLGSKQRRALLAALLLRNGRSATVAELIDGVWGEYPTPSAVGALRNHILHLRRVLEPERSPGSPSTVLVGFGGGYALRLAPGAVDVEQAEELVLQAQCEQISDAPAQSVQRIREQLDTALRLWSGTPLAGLPGPFAERQRVQLTERRVTLLEQRIELDLRLGRHAEVVAELTPLCAEHPLREQARALLMTALYHAGRQAEALSVYAETRRLLIDRLGIEPGPQLTELHQQILQGSLGAQRRSRPVAERRSEPAPSATLRRVAQLPADVADFTGRAGTIRQIAEWLSRTDGRAVPVCAIGGMGGIGKSALAVHVAHLIRDRFPDGQLHVDLHGFGSAQGESAPYGKPPADALGDMLRALGVQEGELATAPTERSAQLRSCLDGKRVLVVLDNAHDVDQVLPLIPGSSGSAVLITSRAALPELPGLLAIRLEVLNAVEARRLLTGIAGVHRVAAEPDAVDEVLTACGGLPLAVRIVGARLAARPRWTIADLAGRLSDEHQRLATLRTGDLAVQGAFRLSYDQLDSAQARAFRLLAAPDIAEVALEAAAAVLGTDQLLVEELCESLVDLNLMDSPAPGRYTYHDLLRLFARELPCGAVDSADGAMERLLDHYLATMKDILAVCNPGTTLPEYLRTTCVPGLSFPNAAAAQDWLSAQRPNLVSLYQQAAHHDGPVLAIAADIAWAGAELIDGGPNCEELARALEQLLAATLRAGDRAAECRVRVALGALFTYALGALRRGRDHQRIALTLPIGSDTDARLTGFAAQLLASSTRMGTETAASLAHAERAIRLAGRVGDRAIECACLVHMAKTLSDAGEYAPAQERATAAKELARTIGNPALEAMATHELGACLAYQGDHAGGVSHCEEAVRLSRLSGVRLREGWALSRLAHVQLIAGRPCVAEPLVADALRVLTRATGPMHRARVMVLHGLILQCLGRADDAYAAFRSAAEVFAPMLDPQLSHERIDAELEAPIVLVLRDHLDQVIEHRRQRHNRRVIDAS